MGKDVRPKSFSKRGFDVRGNLVAGVRNGRMEPGPGRCGPNIPMGQPEDAGCVAERKSG